MRRTLASAPETAVVLGGGSEIGRGILAELAADGLRSVLLVGPRKESLDATARALRGRAVEVSEITLDLTDVAALPALAATARERLQTIDLVLVAAGRLVTGPLNALDPLTVANLVGTNFTGPAAAMLVLAKVLTDQGHGRIVVLSSLAAYRLRPWPYGASKAGLDGFCQGLRDALAGSGVAVTVVRPGFVRTRMTSGGRPSTRPLETSEVGRAVRAAILRDTKNLWIPSSLGASEGIRRLIAPGVRRVCRRFP